jgi:hypothetical protein
LKCESEMRRLDGGMTGARSVDGLSMCDCTGTVSDHVSVPYLICVSAGTRRISVSVKTGALGSTTAGHNGERGKSAGLGTTTRTRGHVARRRGRGSTATRGEAEGRAELVRCRLVRVGASKTPEPSSIDGEARSPENGSSHRLTRPPRAPRSVRGPSPSPRRRPEADT